VADGRIAIAVLGCGRIARLVHFDVLQRSEALEVVAVADIDPAARSGVAARFPKAAVHTSWEGALDHPGLRAVLIALPTPLHAVAAAEALRRGLHVYLEKPTSVTADEAAQIVAAQPPGAFAQLGLNLRFNALVADAKARIQAAEVGDVRSVRVCICSPKIERPAWAGQSGGEVLHDLGVHALDLARWLTGRGISAVTARRDGDRAWLVAELDGGCIASLVVDRASSSFERVDVQGDRGALWFERLSGVAVGMSGRRSPLRPVQRARKWRNPGFEPSYDAALAAFVAGVRGAPDARAATLEDGLQLARALDAAAASDGMRRALAR
jgi:predicted dehydrogenase